MFFFLPDWAQLVLPAILLAGHVIYRVFISPSPVPGKTMAEVHETELVTAIVMYVGLACATPLGVTYYLAAVKTGMGLWMPLFWGSSSLAAGLYTYYRRRGFLPTFESTPLAADLLTRLTFAAFFALHIRLSDLIWVHLLPGTATVFAGHNPFIKIGMALPLTLWVVIGTLFLAAAALPAHRPSSKTKADSPA